LPDSGRSSWTFLDPVAEVLPGLEHHAHGDAGIHDVLVVIAGVVPAAGAVASDVPAADEVEIRVGAVAGGVRERLPVKRAGNRRAAAPQVHGARGGDERSVVHVAADPERRRPAHPGHVENVRAGLLEAREVGRVERLAGVGVGGRAADIPGEHLLAARRVPHHEACGGRGDRGALVALGQEADGVQADASIRGRSGRRGGKCRCGPFAFFRRAGSALKGRNAKQQHRRQHRPQNVRHRRLLKYGVSPPR
jgi:hypothetical protein